MKNIIQYLKRFFFLVKKKELVEPMVYDLKNQKVIIGNLFAHINNSNPNIKHISDAEFQVFSQWGDDGIIQYLINKIDIPNKTFIEFGVENYTESNTRFLLINNNWSGMVIDGSPTYIDYVLKDPISWAHELFAINAFITKENINDLMSIFINKGYDKEIGILSIDIDGNDYWIWKELHVLSPIIIIVEYNSIFGIENPWTIEYNSKFVRGNNKHSSHICYGSSLLSLCDLADEKGYYFIGCNKAGNNAYFVRKDKIGSITPMKPEEGFVISKFRELINENDVRISGLDRLQKLKGLTVYNTRTQEIERIK